MSQVAEVLVTKWVLSHVLYQRTSVGKGMRLLQILCSRCRESLGEERLNVILPKKVDYFLVSEHRIGAANLCPANDQSEGKDHVQEMVGSSHQACPPNR